MHTSPAQRRVALAAVTLLAAIAAAAILAPHGHTAPTSAKKTVVTLTTVTCGTAVTVSITLANDLSNCAGVGLAVTGSHVVVNLNGHTIDGVGSAQGLAVTGAGATVENGTVQQFSTGVVLNGTGSKAQGLRVDNNTTGISLSADSTVATGSFAAANSGAGIEADAGQHLQITNNFARANATGIQILTAATTVSGNKALNNSGDGILVGGAAGIVVTGNVANGNASDGIATGGQTTLSKNIAFFNGALGIAASPFDTDAGGNKADENVTAKQCLNVVCS
jgi:parallel beta-helix repeat protein